MQTQLPQIDAGEMKPESGALRTSGYTIYVDLPGSDEHMLLVHGYTGAYDKVKRSVAAYVRALEIGPVPKPLYGKWLPEELDQATTQTPSEKTVETLKRRGYLTTKTVAEEQQQFVRHVEALQARHEHVMPSYVVLPTYDCNLRCPYCFQDHMRRDPTYSHLLRCITPAMVDRLVSAFVDLESQRGLPVGHGTRREITFFGGEPLLRQSRKSIEYLIQRVKAAGPARFGGISNGTQLEHYQDLLGPGGIEWLQITLDGPPEDHDQRRIHADGSGSFAAIAANIDMALERRVDISLRMNIDRQNIETLPRLARIFIDRGWAAAPNFLSYTAPVTDSGPTRKVGERPKLFNSWELEEALKGLRAVDPAMGVIGSSGNRLQARAEAIFSGQKPGTPDQSSFCGAHKGMYLFDPLGDVYACWDKTGDKNLRVGVVTEDGKIVLNEVDRRWRSRTVASNGTCKQCRFALHCGGGCAVLAESAQGTMFANHCDAYGKRFRAAVAQAFVRASSGNQSDSRIGALAELEAFVR